MGRIRLRFNRHGWFYHLGDMSVGSILAGKLIPDKDGLLTKRLWVGPFNSKPEAMRERAQSHYSVQRSQWIHDHG